MKNCFIKFWDWFGFISVINPNRNRDFRFEIDTLNFNLKRSILISKFKLDFLVKIHILYIGHVNHHFLSPYFWRGAFAHEQN